MQEEGLLPIVVTGETDLFVICRIELETEHRLDCEDVIMRACSSLSPDIIFEPSMLSLKDGDGFDIDLGQSVFSGERVALYSKKGDPLKSRERCGVLLPGRQEIEVVPYSVKDVKPITVYMNIKHDRVFTLCQTDKDLLKVCQEEIVTKFDVWCFIEDTIELSTPVRVTDRRTNAREVMYRALAQFGLQIENYTLVGANHIVNQYDRLRIKKKPL